jgi:hypothetical protein
VPVRTPRGRSAAYRALWQWPLRSPARLGFTAVLVLAAVAGVVAAVAALRGPDDTVVAAPSPPSPPPSALPTPAPTPAATVLPPVPELAPTTLPPSAAPGPALSVAAQWAAAWVNHPEGVSSEQWVAGLRPFTTEEYVPVLAGVNPDNVPSTQVVGEPRAVRVAPRSVQVEVPTNAAILSLLVVSTEDGWRVAGYDRA